MIASYGIDDITFFLSSGIVFFIIFFVPVVVLHLNYYLKNKGDLFIYDGLNQRINFNHKGMTFEFIFEDIKYVKQFRSYPLAENRFQWTPWDNYNYSVIYLKNGESMIITSLLVPNLDLPIPQNKKQLIKSFYCYASTDYKDELKLADNRLNIPGVFRKRIRKKSTKELEEIVSSEGQYDELFILCANMELQNRNRN
jgi:hypothetical protein